MKKLLLLSLTIFSLGLKADTINNLQKDIDQATTEINKNTQQLVDLKKNAENKQAIKSLNEKIQKLKTAMLDEIKTQKNNPKAIASIKEKYLPQINDLLKQKENEFLKIPEIKNLTDTLNNAKQTITSKKEQIKKLKHK